jgi:hypothetical protein
MVLLTTVPEIVIKLRAGSMVNVAGSAIRDIIPAIPISVPVPSHPLLSAEFVIKWSNHNT